MDGHDLEENRLLGRAPLASRLPIMDLALAGSGTALAPVHLSLAFGESRAFRHNGASISMDGTSSDLAV